MIVKLGRDLTCTEMVELMTEYLEGRLSFRARGRFERHLARCDGCTTFFDQIRQTIGATRRLREDDIPVELEERLLAAFRGWSAGD